MSHIVTLNDTQMKIVKGHARLRTKANRKIGRKDNKTPRFDGLTLDEVGVAGELCAHLVTGIEWTGMFIPGTKLLERSRKPIPDLGDDIEVRTALKPTYRLMAHRNDLIRWRFVLVRRLAFNQFDVVGWQHGKEIKQKQYWNQTLHYPAYTYPTALLLPMEDLK